ncbi:MAG: FAD-dependent oxidoreductase [Pseudanabaenales cyanobacterium]|nr:FAD-dependent oxidoreductase [Pseudanabaenales cyanobacterium]
MTMDYFDYDVVIIGGGPAGCTCALYTARADFKTVILDKNPAAGALAITHKIANYPGVDGEVGGYELLEEIRAQAIEFGADYKQAQVFSVDVSDTQKKVYTPAGIFRCRALVLASGAMGRGASIPGESEYLGRGVSYCATCDGAFMRDREVVVVGGSEEAIAEAHVLTKFASAIHWVTPKEPTMTNIHVENLLAHQSVKLWSKTRLLEIEGAESGVTAVKVLSKGREPISIAPVEGVFIYLQGAKPITDFLGGQIELKPDGGVKVDDMMQTNIAGIWAIGDIRNTPFKQAVSAAGDGCIAAMDVDRYLNQRRNIKPDWS